MKRAERGRRAPELCKMRKKLNTLAVNIGKSVVQFLHMQIPQSIDPNKNTKIFNGS